MSIDLSVLFDIKDGDILKMLYVLLGISWIKIELLVENVVEKCFKSSNDDIVGKEVFIDVWWVV